jgi:hypothetical protein
VTAVNLNFQRPILSPLIPKYVPSISRIERQELSTKCNRFDPRDQKGSEERGNQWSRQDWALTSWFHQTEREPKPNWTKSTGTVRTNKAQTWNRVEQGGFLFNSQHCGPSTKDFYQEWKLKCEYPLSESQPALSIKALGPYRGIAQYFPAFFFFHHPVTPSFVLFLFSCYYFLFPRLFSILFPITLSHSQLLLSFLFCFFLLSCTVPTFVSDLLVYITVFIEK